MSNLYLTLPLLAPVIAVFFINLLRPDCAEREAAMDGGDSPDDRAGVATTRPVVNPFFNTLWGERGGDALHKRRGHHRRDPGRPDGAQSVRPAQLSAETVIRFGYWGWPE